MSDVGLRAGIRRGGVVFAVLAAATLIEFVVATSDVPGALLVLALIAIAKAWLIVDFFMHIRQLREAAQ